MTKDIFEKLTKGRLIESALQKILELKQANMDCLFNLDAFACLVYIVDYINKTDRGMYSLLRAVNAKIKEVFLNSSAIST